MRQLPSAEQAVGQLPCHARCTIFRAANPWQCCHIRGGNLKWTSVTPEEHKASRCDKGCSTNADFGVHLDWWMRSNKSVSLWQKLGT